jgi:hypothetical protein
LYVRRAGRSGAAACCRAGPLKPGLGDVAIVLAFTGPRWEEAVAVPIGQVNQAGQSMYIDRTASESGGRRDIREEREPRLVRPWLMRAER